ncbi:hypothetical protein LOTGIDRAFT_156010 [Lottia gigantea]|uniref:Novel STAND NTPase 3 domain-containing protein n=1 Tax=Lottia gigantea TaxID=225164 RepID=V4BFV2_LOTGI|nr:hypothetical protein LOTGIDRAFT_156010 [Lottia gigantea]ESP04787.1 hypothetical protein LOTGIDRAFT_156010 [Lottia gigantea]
MDATDFRNYDVHGLYSTGPRDESENYDGSSTEFPCDAGHLEESENSNGASAVNASNNFDTQGVLDRVSEKCGSSCDSYHSDSPDSDRSMVPFNNDIFNSSNGIVGILNPNVNIGKATNLTYQQFITDDGTELLPELTDKLMEDVNCYFDISETKAWQSVLNTDKIAFVVGHSESFKRSISLQFYEKYRSRVDVFKLDGTEDWKIFYKRSEPFAIFMEDAFGPLGTEFPGITLLIKNHSTFQNLEAALFTMSPLSFERNKENLKKCMKRELSDYVVHLEKEDILSEDDKRVILKKSFELVKDNGRSLKKTNNDGTICFENFIDDILGMAENPIFLDTCEEFVVYERHDENVLQFFSLPLDCFINDIKYLKEKWPDGYHVLRLVASF